MRTILITKANEREVKVKIRILLIVTLILLNFIIPGCKTDKTTPLAVIVIS